MNKDSLNEQLQDLAAKLAKFKKAIFIVAVALIYVFLLYRITILKNAQPKQNMAADQPAATTTIDQATVDKINELQNNSVNVQALFNQARQNPFSE